MIDTEKETLIEFGEAAKRLPRTAKGKTVHVRTIARWTIYGIRGVKLDSVCVGARRVTSVEAIQRFMRRLTEVSDDARNPRRPPRQTPSAVRAKLTAKGLIDLTTQATTADVVPS